MPRQRSAGRRPGPRRPARAAGEGQPARAAAAARARPAAPRLAGPLDEVLDADADGAASACPSTRGRAARKCSLAVTRPRPGRPVGTSCGDLAVDLGVVGVTEAQLEPGPEDVADRGPEVGPARSAGDQVQAEGQAALGEGLQLHLELVELGAQGAPAVDDQEHVAVAVVGGALPPAAPVGLDRVDALPAEVRLAAVDDALAPRPPSRRTTSGSERVRRRRRAAARSSARTCRHRSRARRTATRCGVVVSARLVTIVRSSVDLPLRGPPTTATWPAGTGEVDPQHVAALLARPVDDAERHVETARAPATTARPGRAPGRSTRSPISGSRVSGTSSGGSQTWCAGGPWPSIRSTAMSSTARGRRRARPGASSTSSGSRLAGGEHVADGERQDAARAYAEPRGGRADPAGRADRRRRRP